MPNVLSPINRRPPYPYDAYIGDIGVMLDPKQDGQMVSRKSKALNPVALAPEYGTNDPRLEIAYPAKNVVLGMGLKTQPTNGRIPRRYYYMINGDASIDGQPIKGPLFHPYETVAAGQPIRQFVRNRFNGAFTIFAIAGTKLTVKTADGSPWTTLATLGDSTFNQMARYTHAGATGNALYRTYLTADANHNLMYYEDTGDATGFHEMSTTEGPGPSGVAGGRRPRWVAEGNGELYVYEDQDARRLLAPSNDPVTSASWSGTFVVGDKSYRSTGLIVDAGVPHFFKETSIYTLNADGSPNDLFPGFIQAASIENGKNARSWLRNLYFRFGDGFVKLKPDGSMQGIGQELLLHNDSEVAGYPVAWVPHNTWFLYYVIYNPITGASHLMKYGAWIESEGDNNPQLLEYVDVHHGSLATWAGKQVTALDIFPTEGTNDRLYVGFSDGTATWCYLPRNHPDPTADPNCEFTDQPTYFYPPENTGGYAADFKLYRGFAVFGPKLSPSAYCELEYRTSDDADWAPLRLPAAGSAEAPPEGVIGENPGILTVAQGTGDIAKFTVPGQRIDYPQWTTLIAKSLQTRLVMLSDSTTQTPEVEGLAIYQQVRPPLLLEYIVTVQARNFMAKYNGQVDWRTAEDIRNGLLSLAGIPGTVKLIPPSGVPEEVAIIDFQEQIVASAKRYGIEWEITIGATQFKALTVQGAIVQTGMTYGEMEAYTYAQLEALL
jgi:hypothetical protein